MLKLLQRCDLLLFALNLYSGTSRSNRSADFSDFDRCKGSERHCMVHALILKLQNSEQLASSSPTHLTLSCLSDFSQPVLTGCLCFLSPSKMCDEVHTSTTCSSCVCIMGTVRNDDKTCHVPPRVSTPRFLQPDDFIILPTFICMYSFSPFHPSLRPQIIPANTNLLQTLLSHSVIHNKTTLILLK